MTNHNPERLLEERLGLRLDRDRAGSIPHLNAVPPTLIASARMLNDPALARLLLAFYVASESRPYVDLFVQDVVFGTTAPEAWLRGRTLVPDWSFQDQVTLPREVLCAPLGRRFEQRIVPSLADWQSNTSWVGAPCLPQPDADYLRPVPQHTVALSEVRTEVVDDSTVAVRRWIAARIAMVVKSQVGTDFREAEVAAAVLVPLSKWTVDGRAALDALIREALQLGSGIDAPPGFRAPDEWFLQRDQ